MQMQSQKRKQALQKKQSLFVEKEGLISVPGGVEQISPFALGERDSDTISSPQTVELHPFIFGRIFPPTNVPPPKGPIDTSPYEELSRAMEKVAARDHPNLPAGYTYLAQFIAHDMSFLEKESLPKEMIEPLDVATLRSPSLDLDSLYGKGPASDTKLYKEDGLRFRIGLTEPAAIGGDSVRKEFENDLLRVGGSVPNPREAIIADRRNDDNLLVAQTQVAFMKFHNAVADYNEEKYGSGQVSFDAVREQVVKHYQWIILHDLLPRILDEKVLNSIRDDPSKRLFNPGSRPTMPVEFAFAAFRLGHCMVRDRYELNRVFQSPPTGARAMMQRQAAGIGDLIEMTGSRGRMQGLSERLPSNWIVDWTRFYDFSDFGLSKHPQSNNAKIFGPHMSPALGSLFRFSARARNMVPISLAVFDLVRGAALGLPTGQELAEKLYETPLSDVEILDSTEPSIQDILTGNKFVANTPLWYYILKEAEVKGGGERLGPVGSRIVAETFVGLIESSPFTILKGCNWKPDLAKLKEFGRVKASKAVFEMSDLLMFVEKFLQRPDMSASELNPIG